MYKLVIIDDNIILLKSLTCSVDWESLGCQCVGTAVDGVSGKALIERERPHIVLTDIRMPGLDGLEMIKLTRHIQPSCKIIILTGYERFEYAKKALSLSVNEFLLKPVDIQELEKAVRKQVKDLTLENALRDEHQREAEQYLHQASFLKDNSCIRKTYALYQLLNTEEEKSGAALKILSEEGVADKGYVIAAVAKCVADGEFSPEEAEAVKKAVLGHYAGKQTLEILSFFYFNRVLVLTCFCRRHNGPDSAKELSRTIRIALQEQVLSGRPYKFAISDQMEVSIKKYRSVFNKTMESLRKKLYFAGSEGYDRALGDTPALVASPLSAQLTQYLEQLCITEDPQESNLLLQEMAHEVALRCNGNIPLIENAMILFCVMMTSQMIPTELYEESFSFEEIAAGIKSSKNLSMLVEYVFALYLRCHKRRTAVRPAYSLLIQSFYSYVRENAGKNPTLTETAAYLSVSPNYLSSLIKKETGENFTDIVIRAKIDLSKKYLKNVAYRIEDVAEIVGYSNYISFYKAFKKYTGMTPKQYRNRRQEGDSLC